MATKTVSEATLVVVLRCSSRGWPSWVRIRTVNNIKCFRLGTWVTWSSDGPGLSTPSRLACPPTIHHTPGPAGRPEVPPGAAFTIVEFSGPGGGYWVSLNGPGLLPPPVAL